MMGLLDFHSTHKFFLLFIQNTLAFTLQLMLNAYQMI
jgi:hypothetical protein